MTMHQCLVTQTVRRASRSREENLVHSADLRVADGAQHLPLRLRRADVVHLGARCAQHVVTARHQDVAPRAVEADHAQHAVVGSGWRRRVRAGGGHTRCIRRLHPSPAPAAPSTPATPAAPGGQSFERRSTLSTLRRRGSPAARRLDISNRQTRERICWWRAEPRHLAALVRCARVPTLACARCRVRAC